MTAKLKLMQTFVVSKKGKDRQDVMDDMLVKCTVNFRDYDFYHPIPPSDNSSAQCFAHSVQKKNSSGS